MPTDAKKYTRIKSGKYIKNKEQSKYVKHNQCDNPVSQKY